MNNYFDDNPRGRSRGSSGYSRENRRPVQGSGRGNVRRGGRGGSRGRKAPVALLIIIDVLAGALLLLIFYVTNFIMTGETKGEALPTPTPTEVVVAPPVTTGTGPTDSVVTDEPTPTPTIDPNDWRAKFADKFTSGDVEKTDNSYKSANISITINKVQQENITYFFADIYLADLKYLKTAFPVDSDKMGKREHVDKVAGENNAILAINGDNCLDNNGLVIRNGQLYPRSKTSADVLVLNYDGTMQTYSPEELDKDKIISEGAYQSWAFGPMLLKDGEAMTQFNSTQQIGGENPRTALGYFEPGHYCFIVVDGRQPGYSDGYTFKQLSQLCKDLGCKAAINMDGGQSSQLFFMGNYVNQPYNNGRPITDIVYIGEE